MLGANHISKKGSTMSTIGNVRPLSGYIGAEITGLDLSTLDDGATAAVRAAFLEHQVLFFPRQHLSPDALCEFASCFGEVESPHSGLKVSPENPKVFRSKTKDGEGDGKYNDIWHSDVSFQHAPPAASVIQAKKVPVVGGDTLFASMYAAYETLSAPIRVMIEPLEAVHDGVPNFTKYLLGLGTPDARERLEEMKANAEVSTHPLVRCHPETGRKAIYINRSFTTRILGLSDIENRNLMSLLLEHIEQASFQMRWRWSEGDVGIWDNRCALHYAARDYGDAHREMERVTVKGDQPCR